MNIFCKIITAGYMLGEWLDFVLAHYTNVRMSVMGSQITSVSIVCSTVCSGTDQRKNQSFASLAFVRGIHRSPVNSPHKEPVMRKMFPFDDIIMSQGKVQESFSANSVATLTRAIVILPQWAVVILPQWQCSKPEGEVSITIMIWTSYGLTLNHSATVTIKSLI